MKEFDWSFAEKNRNPRLVAWLKENHGLPVSEERYVNEVSLIYRQDRIAGKYKHLNWKQYRKNAPNHQKRAYKHLKEKFGFFLGV